MQYDVTVIGGGPGGYVAAIKAAQYGKRVCLIEREYLGGVCLNVGCIPTKTLLQTVEVLHTAQKAAQFAVTGIDPACLGVDLKRLQARKEQVVGQLTGGVGALLKKNKVTVRRGTVVFADKNTVTVDGAAVTSDCFILATGSRPFTPASIAVAPDAEVLTSTQALCLTQVPARLGVVGGGVVGIEFAYLYRALGAEVHVFEAMEQILPMIDGTIAALARREMERQGIVFHTGVKVTGVTRDGISYQEAGAERRYAAGSVLMAVGRAPNTGGLGLEKLGVRLERGAVVTDEFLRTNVPNLYAIGDVNAHLMLAHTASREAQTAVDHICTGKAEPVRYDAIPSCVYIHPELAAVGLTEQQARERGLDVAVGSFPLSANGKALVEGETTGLIKIIADRRTGELYGAHIMGPRATDLIGELAAALYLEATAESMTCMVHPHPTLSEIIPEAALSALGKGLHSA